MILRSLSAVSAFTALSSSCGVAANASLKCVNAFLTFSIPNGFYSAPGLASEIIYAAGNATGITVQYLSSQGVMLFTNTPLFSMIINSAQLAPLLGFPTSVKASQSTRHFC